MLMLGTHILYIVGGCLGGLTSQALHPLSCGSDRISYRNPAQPHTSDRCVQAEKSVIIEKTDFHINSDFTIYGVSLIYF